MKNEPVAWSYIKDGEFWDAIHPDEHAQEEGSYTIPLYTHPVKELTDEEIISTMVQFDVYSSDDHCLIEAGRAIMKRAQEK